MTKGKVPKIGKVFYQADRTVVSNRLNLLGCTSAVAKERLALYIEDERARWNEYLEERGVWAAATANMFQTLSPDGWYARVPIYLASRYKLNRLDKPADEIDRTLRDDDLLWFDQSLVGLIAILDACRNAETVLDVTELVLSGYLDYLEIDTRRASALLEKTRPLEPTVIMGEGSSDVRVLERSLSILFPELEQYFSFFNHSELNVDGGASYLVKFLKAFAGARAPFRVVAVFDNDAVGIKAYRQAKSLRLPENIIVELPGALARDRARARATRPRVLHPRQGTRATGQ